MFIPSVMFESKEAAEVITACCITTQITKILN